MSAVCEPPVNSTHRVEVVPVVLNAHGNADSLSIVKVDDYTCVVNTVAWEGKGLAAWIPPDSLVPADRPEFAFLAKDANAEGLVRIKAKKLRGVLSFGLLVPAPEGAAAGDDVTGLLGVTHWNPPEGGGGGRKDKKPPLFEPADCVKAPDVPFVKYDLEAGRKYARRLFIEGENVLTHEKVHGQSSRYVFHNGVMHCSSRSQWKREFPDYSHVTVEMLAGKVDDETAKRIVERLRTSPPKRDTLWQALENTPSLRKFCEANPGLVVYGEVLGVQDLRYGLKPGEVSFLAFDLMDAGRWVDGDETRARLSEAGVPQVPLLHDGPFDFDLMCSLAEGQSTVAGAGHVREGCVVKLSKERWDERVGRACLKFVGCGYLERS